MKDLLVTVIIFLGLGASSSLAGTYACTPWRDFNGLTHTKPIKVKTQNNKIVVSGADYEQLDYEGRSHRVFINRENIYEVDMIMVEPFPNSVLSENWYELSSFKIRSFSASGMEDNNFYTATALCERF